jgi:hypothetical protein
VVRAEGLHDHGLRCRPAPGRCLQNALARALGTARASGANAASMLAGLQKGWTQTVDRLGVLLEPRPHKEM